ncbi:hypothetical protein [Hungatella effluvii]|uniref:hypothetical protein n=1 Tax=Hungatella effluvii TaxID=1096246 RepID=UPI002A7F6E2E|nr:hypothetical protein [Hungatella effluvii]
MNNLLSTIQIVTYVFCLMVLPLIYIFSFASHPNLLNLKPTKTAVSWASEIRHNKKLHLLHLLVLASSLPAINIALNFMEIIGEQYRIFALSGGTLAIIGSVALAADKGALCLVPSAFDTLEDEEYNQLLPGLQTLLDNKGFIWVVHFLVLLPIGFIILSIGLILSGAVSMWQGVTLIIGMLFMINPDIDLLSLIGSCFMLISFGSIGIGLIL